MIESRKQESGVSDQARDWVLRLASGEMDAAELDRFKVWIAASELHARAFEKRRSLWLDLGEHPELFSQKAAAEASPASAQPIPPVRQRRARWSAVRPGRHFAAAGAAVAASLLAVVIAPEVVLRVDADHRTSTHVGEYTLPDGSTAWLDAESAISVDFDANQRKVTLLRGNAFFTVRHGEARPFRVAALQGVVEDIGTSFEVRRQTVRVDVSVEEGAVRVAPGSGQDSAIILREGEGAAYDASGGMSRLTIGTPRNIAAWRREELMIDRRPLEGAIREIARYRSGPTWIWADLGGRSPVNGAFRVHDADAALRDLAAVQGLSVTWLPGGLAIVREARAAH